MGGGSGGCTIAAKFARRLRKDAVIVLEPSEVCYFETIGSFTCPFNNKMPPQFAK